MVFLLLKNGRINDIIYFKCKSSKVFEIYDMIINIDNQLIIRGDFMWALVVIGIIVFIFLLAISIYQILFKNEKIGYEFLYNSEKIHNRTAPKLYYDKQRLYRFYYGFFIGLHYFFVIASVVFSALTITMVMDIKGVPQTVKLIISSLATITNTFQVILRFDKIAIRKLYAVRILEQAIIDFEYNDDEDYSILVEANKKAEETIQIDE